MSTMIDRVAAAILAGTLGCTPEEAPRRAGAAAFSLAQADARAAIAAIREPTDDIIKAGADAMQFQANKYQAVHDVMASWRAMVEEALKEPVVLSE